MHRHYDINTSRSFALSTRVLFISVTPLVKLFIISIHDSCCIISSCTNITGISRYKEFMIRQMLFRKFSEVLPALSSARAIGNLWSICLEVNTLRHERSETSTTRSTRAKSEGRPIPLVDDNSRTQELFL